MVHISRTRRPPRRGAFTLLELLLVLSLLVIGFAMAWPVLQGAWDQLRLRKGADQVRTLLSKARLTAVTSGEIHVFRYQLGGDQCRLSAWSGSDAALDAASSAGPNDGDAASTSLLSQLPDDVTFVAAPPQAYGESTSAAASQRLGHSTYSTADGWSAPVMFFPDGTSTDARITLSGVDNRRVAIELRGLTGTVRMDDVATGEY